MLAEDRCHAFGVAGADEVRRSAKQTARSLEQQSEAVSASATHAAKQITSFASLARATVEQGSAREQLARSVEQLRVRARDVVTLATHQSKRSVTITADARAIAEGVGELGQSYAAQSSGASRPSGPPAKESMESG